MASETRAWLPHRSRVSFTGPVGQNPGPKARTLPTRVSARDVGAEANRVRLAGPASISCGLTPRVERRRLVRVAAELPSLSRGLPPGSGAA
jgi:hypothetical protein